MPGSGITLETLLDDPAPLVAAAYEKLCGIRNARMEPTEAEYRIEALTRQDLAYHIRYIGTAAYLDDEPSLIDYIEWLAVLSSNLKLKPAGIADSLIAIEAAATALLKPEDAELLSEYLRKALAAWRAPQAMGSNPYTLSYISNSGTAIAYLTALTEGKRRLASSLVQDLVSSGWSLRRLYDELFVPTLREIGFLWHQGKISVAQEHFATAATQFIVSELYHELFIERPTTAGVLITACAQGELHEVGIRMIADCFQMEGWETIHLGANLPVKALLDEVNRHRPALLALSATLPVNVRWIEKAIRGLRSDRDYRPRIIVGGRPFGVSARLAEKVGADYSAVDCSDALSVAASLVS